MDPTVTPESNAPSTSATDEESFVDLGAFSNPEYDPGRGKLIRTVWYFVSLLVFESGLLPVSGLKRRVLRWFGATIGEGLVIKPHVRIKFPWRLTIGNHCWIGQEVWIDNQADVSIGNHVCVSQRTYFCTGSHDHRSRTFDLITKPIRIGDGAWLGAGSMVLGGATVHSNAVVAGGSLVVKDVPASTIVGGNPAKPIGRR